MRNWGEIIHPKDVVTKEYLEEYTPSASGHVIINSDDEEMPQRSKLKFLDSKITDDEENDETTIEPLVNIKADATVDSSSGTPSVDVKKSGTPNSPLFTFNFHNLKGEKGDPAFLQFSIENGDLYLTQTTPTPDVEFVIEGKNLYAIIPQEDAS